MNEFLKLPADKRRVIYEQVSLRMGINDAKAIEKDVWVTGILQCVFTLPYAHALVFNPNRSLGFGQIARLCHAACFSPSRRRSGLR